MYRFYIATSVSLARKLIGVAQIVVLAVVLFYAGSGFLMIVNAYAVQARVEKDSRLPASIFEQNIDDRVSDNTRRIDSIETLHLDARLVRLETTTESIMRILIGVLIGICGLLVDTAHRLWSRKGKI